MAMGGPGDHPITDIVSYNLPVFSSKIDSLIREIDKYLPWYRMANLMNWFSPPPLDEMEAILTKKLEELKKEAQNRGWDLELIKNNSKEGERFNGMTVNERLFEAKLLDAFDLAVIKRDRKKLIEILKTVELSDEQANSTIDTIFLNPKKYGYE